MSRDRRLLEAYDLVVRTMNLRLPQAEALKEIRDAIRRLPDRLSRCSSDQRREFLALKENINHPYHPTFTLALATGVGKTRLAGALMAFLWLSGEAKTFLILAPRRAVLRRFESALDPRFREYIFIDPNLLPEPSIIRSDEIDSPSAVDFQTDMVAGGPRIYLLSPQLISTSARFKDCTEFAEKSPADALRERGDLVVLVDEAHHVGKLSKSETTAWSKAIRELYPCMQIGLTATPRGEPGENVLYEYPLNRALASGLYTKSVHIKVRKFTSETLSAEDIDRTTIDFALQRLEKKTAAAAVVEVEGFPAVKPVAVFFARNIDHAEEVRGWLLGTGRLQEQELLITHSKMAKSEEDLERLLNIETVDNPVRVVVNVMELTEGWDVTNVYVIAPLRAMATFTGALQSLGRGLRLPAGRRIEDPVLDSLDVICFGKEPLEKIVREATEWSEQPIDEGSGGLRISVHDSPDIVRSILNIPAKTPKNLMLRHMEIRHEELDLNLSPEALNRVQEAMVSSLELAEAESRISGAQERARIDRTRFIEAAAMRAIRKMARHLSDDKHFDRVSEIVEKWVDRAAPNSELIQYDPLEVGEEIARQLADGARRQLAIYADTGKDMEISLKDFTIELEVEAGDDGESPKLKIGDLPVYSPSASFLVRQPYKGWHRCIHEACAFDSESEAKTAWMLDNGAEVVWWARNEPKRLAIPTPAGNYHPDFIVEVKKLDGDEESTLLLEIKGDLFWDAPSSDARFKAAAAREWCEAQTSLGHPLKVRVGLEGDVEKSSSFAELRPRLLTGELSQE